MYDFAPASGHESFQGAAYTTRSPQPARATAGDLDLVSKVIPVHVGDQVLQAWERQPGLVVSILEPHENPHVRALPRQPKKAVLDCLAVRGERRMDWFFFAHRPPSANSAL